MVSYRATKFESPTLTVSEHCLLHTPTLYPFGGRKCQLTKNLFNKKVHPTAPHLNTIIHTKTRKHAKQWILAGQSAPSQKIWPHVFINSILLIEDTQYPCCPFHKKDVFYTACILAALWKRERYFDANKARNNMWHDTLKAMLYALILWHSSTINLGAKFHLWIS